jgi:DNA-binding PadR family transcriptional regulator
MPKKSMDILTESMFYVLMALCREDMCGADTAAFVEERTRGRVLLGPATLYTILGKFEKEKYIKEIQVDGRKRTYRITDKGRKAFAEELNRLRQCVADAEGGTP